MLDKIQILCYNIYSPRGQENKSEVHKNGI